MILFQAEVPVVNVYYMSIYMSKDYLLQLKSVNVLSELAQCAAAWS